MSEDLVFGIRLKADGSGLVGELRVSKRELDQVTGTTREAGRAADRTGKDVERMGREYQRGSGSIDRMNQAKSRLLRTLVTAAGAWLSYRGAARLMDDFARQEQASARLEQTIASTGRTTAGLSDELQQLASQVQREGIFGDEVIIEGQAVLALFGEISDDLMPRATRVLADLAATMGGDVASAARALGMASEGSTDLLRRQGIVISDAARESGDFAQILAELEGRVGGMNRALAGTASGGMQQFRNEIGDLREVLGGAIAQVWQGAQPAMIALVSLIKDDLAGAVNDNENAIDAWGEALIDNVRRFMIGGAGVVDTLEAPVRTIRNLADDIWQGFERLGAIPGGQEVGILGLLLAGTKGRLAILGTMKFMSDAQTTANWWQAYQRGTISFAEWFTTGHDKAKAQLEELRGLGFSIGEGTDPIFLSLFGSDEDQDAHVGSAEARLQAFFDRMDAEIEKRKQSRGSSVLPGLGDPPADSGGGFTPDDQEARLQAFERLQESLLSEEEALQASYHRRAQIVGEALAAKVASEEGAAAVLDALDEQYQQQRLARQQQVMAEEQRMRQTTLMLGINLLNVLGREHKGAAITALALQKGAAIAQLTIDTQNAMMKARAVLGPGAGDAAAARIFGLGVASGTIILGTGLLEASQISRGAGASGGATTAQPVFSADPITSLPTSGQQSQQSVVQVHLHGDVFGWDEYVERRIIDGIKHAVDDKDVVFISQTSRQAQELRV